MKVLYFDCSSGISGNMTLAALLEIIEDNEYFLNEIKKLNIDGYKIEISKKIKNGITATYVDVILDEHNHSHRHLSDIYQIIDESKLDDNIKKLAKEMFLKVAEAESKVHNKDLNEVHFHEVGAIDSIIDIVGSAILINKIKPDIIYSSIVNDGYGFINCAHGKMAVPVPATLEIFKNNKVKFRQIDIPTELVTPTGAAIIATLVENYQMMPSINLEKIGYGAGSKDLEIPNILRVSYGEILENEQIVKIESNIDDSNGETLAYTMELLFKAGALDVFYTPIYMKKNRPSYLLNVICNISDLKKLENIIFRETTTIGLRYYKVNRTKLERKKSTIKTKYGNIDVKIVKLNDEVFTYPEYESIKEIANKNNIPLKELYKLVGN